MRISNLAQVEVPCPEGAFITGIRNLLVGRGIGPFFLMPCDLHTLSICPHTDPSASSCVDDNRMRAFCMFHSPVEIIFKIYGSCLNFMVFIIITCK